MNFNKNYKNKPFKFKSLIYFDDNIPEYNIGIIFNDDIDNKFMVESFNECEYKRWSVNPSNNNIIFKCDIKYSYFFRIQSIDNENNTIYYGFYNFDVDCIPNHIKNYFVQNSESYKEGLTLFIKENIAKHNYRDFINQQYEFISNEKNDNNQFNNNENNTIFSKETAIKNVYSDESDDDDKIKFSSKQNNFKTDNKDNDNEDGDGDNEDNDNDNEDCDNEDGDGDNLFNENDDSSESIEISERGNSDGDDDSNDFN